jgi:hypothetical protein
LLAWLARREGFRLGQIYNFERRTWKGDVLLVIAATAVAAPLGYFPNALLARALFANPGVVIPMMFRPLPEWAIVVAAFVFPVTIALSELPNYYGYVLPIKKLTGAGWQIVMLVGLSHALQHVTLSAFVRCPVHAVAIRHVPAVCAFRRLPGQPAPVAAPIPDGRTRLPRCFSGDSCPRRVVAENSPPRKENYTVESVLSGGLC